MTELGHESSRIWSGSIFLAAGTLSVTVIAVLVVSRWLFAGLAQPSALPAPFPLDPQAREDRPAPPRLEGIERLEGAKSSIHADDLRPDRQSALRKYSWVDRKAGIVRIPIDQAMKILVETNRPPAVEKEKR